MAEALSCKVNWDQTSQTVTVTYSANILDLPLENNGNGPGPLTEENTSLGGIHLGDRQSRVLALYGAPTSKSLAHGSGFPFWYYGQDDMCVDFYANGGPVAPDPQVEDIWLDENSSASLRTDKGIGIDSTLEEILDSYGPVGSTAVDPDTQIRNIWFYGPKKETLGQLSVLIAGSRAGAGDLAGKLESVPLVGLLAPVGLKLLFHAFNHRKRM